MCPIVPMFTCGLFRSNFSLAIFLCPQRSDLTETRFYFDCYSLQTLERGTGFEPATITLEEGDSTGESPPPNPLKTLLQRCAIKLSYSRRPLASRISGAWDRD